MESSLPIARTNSAAEDSSGSAGKRTTADHRLRKASTAAATAMPAPPRPPPAVDGTGPKASASASFRGGRRQSIRDPQLKAPLGPRPLDHSKQRCGPPETTTERAPEPDGAWRARMTSDAPSPHQHAAGRSFLPQSTSEPAFTSAPHLAQARAANPRLSFARQPDAARDSRDLQHASDASAAYDFLPAVNFDDFHTSIQTIDPDLSAFPVPGGRASVAFFQNTLPTTIPATHATQPMPPARMDTGPDAFAPGTGAEARPPRTTSLMRRFSQPRRPNPLVPANPIPEVATAPPQPTSVSVRPRRQSQFAPQAPLNPAARAPRKSVGGSTMLPPGVDARDPRHHVPRLASDSPQGRAGRTPSFNQGSRRGFSATLSTLSTGTESSKLASAVRSTKAKSMQPPPRQTPAFLGTSAHTPEHRADFPLGPTRSPGRTPARAHTPSSSSSRRQSTMHHVSGLGARTISPTDTRRLKRLSMNPNPPGGPNSPPTPQAEFAFDDAGFHQSPAMLFRKSLTPSSARGTPDQNRKSYASGISLSSNSSMNSLRLPRPHNLNLSSSRLPTPKPRSVHSSTGGEEEEEVPPVPAIPKAYESPKDPDRSTFSFSNPFARHAIPQPSMHDPREKANTSLSIETGVERGKTDSPRQNNPTIRHRRGLTVGSDEIDQSLVLPHTSKKSLQPINLPPLNLLPLGTPFNNRMSSFPMPSAEMDDRNTTPPPKRAINKTPSTPMTASKASFFSKSNHVEHYESANQLRSSSSAVNVRPSEPYLHSGSTMPIPTLNPGRQTTTTPFASNSLPKGGGEFARLYTRPSGEYKLSDNDVELQNLRVDGPRTAPKPETSISTHNSESTEPGTPSSGTSLRRKLSLGGWRRSSSKSATHASHASQSQSTSHKAEQPPHQPRLGDMPPPRLPASATWSGSITSSPTPSNRTRPSLDFTKRKPSTATIASDSDLEKPNGPRQNNNMGVRIPSGYAEQQAPKASSSLLTPMQRMLGSKSSTNMLRSRNLDSNLDRDDLLADEEMKKLASKRKDFEQAARDVDNLRKRAHPQERVSAAQALQMVDLNIFERGEIIDYKEIYFCGTKTAKKHVGDLNQQTLNFGYDDDRGDYNIVFGDHLAYRYEVVDLLGKGSFGQVVRCVDHKTGLLVAIKIIRNKKRFHQQALVEVNILQKLREWDPENKHSMINFTQSFYFRGHLCISTELLGMNLYEFIKVNEFKGFSLRLIRRFSKQMLGSLVLLRSRRVIHCDLKPENILLAHPLHSELKVIDFGSSCFENEKVYTYIQSRFYRSPEVILGMSYGLPIDMWSLGCILAELLTGYPIFPGENEQEQLACIMEIFGPPEKHLIEKSSRKKLFFDSLGKPRVTVSTKGRRRRPSSKTLQQALKCDDEAFLDFISRCLRWDPDRRMKPDEAMLHEFVTGVRKPGRARPANGASGVSSPAKRFPSTQQTPQSRVRPLPEPPVTSLRSGMTVNSSREILANSPIKSGPPRRHSTVQGPPSSAVKRTMNGAPPNATSSLPRAAQRTASGKPDMAAAAAAASLKSR